MGGPWARLSTHTAPTPFHPSLNSYQGYEEATESSWWMCAPDMRLTRCHQRRNTQPGKADDSSLWVMIGLNSSTLFLKKEIANDYKLSLESKIMTKKINDVKERSAICRAVSFSTGRDSRELQVTPDCHQASSRKMIHAINTYMYIKSDNDMECLNNATKERVKEHRTRIMERMTINILRMSADGRWQSAGRYM